MFVCIDDNSIILKIDILSTRGPYRLIKKNKNMITKENKNTTYPLIFSPDNPPPLTQSPLLIHSIILFSSL